MRRHRRVFAAIGFSAVAFCWPVAGLTQASSTPPSASASPAQDQLNEDLRAIREMNAAAQGRRDELAQEIERLGTMIESARKLAFEIELRIARIEAGEFQLSCEAVSSDVGTLDLTLKTVREMRGEADALCREVSPDNVKAQSICQGRRSTLDEREAELTAARRKLAQACPSAVPDKVGE